MDIKLTIPNEFLPGLESKRGNYNKERKDNLSLEDFISLLLSDWSRHALTKVRQDEAKELVSAYAMASVEDKAKLLEQARDITQPAQPSGGLLDKP